MIEKSAKILVTGHNDLLDLAQVSLIYPKVAYQYQGKKNKAYRMPVQLDTELKTDSLSDPRVIDLLREILIRLDRIETHIEDSIYPDESHFRQDYIEYVQKQETALDAGEGCVYSSMDEFLNSLEEK